jgi:hypothetical protein
MEIAREIAVGLRRDGRCIGGLLHPKHAGVVIDHLDAIARSVRNEDTPALRIEGGVIKLAARGTWYGDGSDYFQRHDDLTAPRALSIALKTIVELEKRKPARDSSTRNLLEHRVLRRAWTETV